MRIRYRIAAAAIAALAVLGGATGAQASSVHSSGHAAVARVNGNPIKEAAGSFCIRDPQHTDSAGVRIQEGNCGPGPGEDLAMHVVPNGVPFEGETPVTFQFVDQGNAALCLADSLGTTSLA